MTTAPRRIASAILGFILGFAGCAPRATVREWQTDTLQQTAMNLAVRVMDDETGLPIPGAWVFASAEIVTEPPVDRYPVVGANRGQTGSNGLFAFARTQGMYRPEAPRDWLWKLVDEKQARLRKPKYIAGGSIVIAAARYGVVHQPFAIEDSPAIQDWLKDYPNEEYGGLLGLKSVANRKALFFKSKELADGIEVTLRLRKPGAAELARQFRWTPFVSATWDATSRQTGASEDLQLEAYRFFAQQMKAAADETHEPDDKAMFEAYYHPKAIDHYIDPNHAPGPQDQPGAIQLWLVQKALEIPSQDLAEAREYVQSIRKGVEDEGSHPRWQNHFLNPTDPSKGLRTFDSAVQWAALDMDNPRNEWDWQDAQRYYGARDKAKAYEALGHVLRLLVNLAVPKYTQMQESKETGFETAVLALMKDQAGQLPPDYWWWTKQPTFATMQRARFDDVAGRTVALGLEAGIGATNGHTESPALFGARKGFPPVIGQAAGLMRDFHQLMHRPRFAGPPGDGNGNGPAVRFTADSSTSATTANHLHQDQIELGSFTEAEKRFLLASLPEYSQSVSSGVVIAYGHVLMPPFLIVMERGRLHIDTYRVFPLEELPDRHLARKRLADIHTRYYLAKTGGSPSAREVAARHGDELVQRGKAASLEFLQGKGVQVRITVGDQQRQANLDSCPDPLFTRYNTIIKFISRGYLARKRSSNAQDAWSWLESRFSELVRIGTVASFKADADEELIRARFSCMSHDWNFGFYRTPNGIDDESSTSERSEQAELELTSIVRALKAGQVLVFSHAFKRAAGRSILHDIKRCVTDCSRQEVRRSLKEDLSLNEEQLERFILELE